MSQQARWHPECQYSCLGRRQGYERAPHRHRARSGRCAGFLQPYATCSSLYRCQWCWRLQRSSSGTLLVLLVSFEAPSALTRGPLCRTACGGRKHHRCDFTKCAKAFSVVSETWCSMPSASASADSVGTPSAHRTSTTSRWRMRTRSASASPFSVRNTPR
jgi:hypothetical protein